MEPTVARVGFEFSYSQNSPRDRITVPMKIRVEQYKRQQLHINLESSW
jgi:hypothetical protein